VSGVIRPATQSALAEGGKALETALKTGRTAKTARPCSAASGRHIRLGTASMATQPDGPFINIARLNLSKYAGNPGLAKPLFEYILYQENDVKTVTFANIS
jgi:tetratricopeptide repeat protein 8